MQFHISLFGLLARGLIVLAVSLGSLIQIGFDRAKPVAPPLGPVLVKDINPTGSASPGQFVSLNNELFFTANDGVHGVGLWQSDGTTLGTKAVITPGLVIAPSAMTSIANLVYFVASSAQGSGYRQLWRTDGSPVGTVRLSGDNTFAGELICGRGGCGNAPALITGVNGNAYFVGHDSVHGSALWWSDGTQSGTLRIKDVIPRAMIAVSNTLFFTDHTERLWKSDGTPDGTQPIKWGSLWREAIAVRSSLFYIGSGLNASLWSSDGTVTGTLPTQQQFEYIGSIASLNGTVIVSGGEGPFRKLWQTDGTTAGTQQLGSFDSRRTFNNWIVVGNRLFMTLEDDTTTNLLISTDGTPEGTQILVEFQGAGTLRYVAAYGDTYIFVLRNEMWVTDGTTSGTFKLVQLRPTNESACGPSYCLLVGNTLYFAAIDATLGSELWSLTFSNKPDVQLNVHTPVLANPAISTSVDVAIANIGAGALQSVTLTATLGMSLTYMSDTSGITPAMQGHTLIWTLPDLDTLTIKSFKMFVGLPTNVIGGRYPITFTLNTQTPTNENKIADIVVANKSYLPLVFRLVDLSQVPLPFMITQ